MYESNFDACFGFSGTSTILLRESIVDAQSFIFGQLVCSSKSPVCPDLFSTHFCYMDILTSNLKITHGTSCSHD